MASYDNPHRACGETPSHLHEPVVDRLVLGDSLRQLHVLSHHRHALGVHGADLCVCKADGDEGLGGLLQGLSRDMGRVGQCIQLKVVELSVDRHDHDTDIPVCRLAQARAHASFLREPDPLKHIMCMTVDKHMSYPPQCTRCVYVCVCVCLTDEYMCIQVPGFRSYGWTVILLTTLIPD